MNIVVPIEAQFIIDTLEDNDFEAYVVGGCVRDAILGAEPKDWDVCTNALPHQIMKCFQSFRIIETGLHHGTVTIVLNNKPFEITTYRIDGEHSDNRRPDKVYFVGCLKEDLARRDFTINAMAYNPNKGLVDYFGGLQDIENKLIRCVGNADARFKEDALRIMRALRFSSVLNFEIEREAEIAIINNKDLLTGIAAERIASELSGLLCGENAVHALHYSPCMLTLAVVIPEIRKMFGFYQNNPYHHLDVWHHTAMAVGQAPPDLIIRLALLFHDIGKPHCYTEDKKGGHFYGHAKISAEITEAMLRHLKYSNEILKSVTELVMYHDATLSPRRKYIKRWLNRIGEVQFRRLIEVKRADTLAHHPDHRKQRLDVLASVEAVLDEIISQGQCFSLKDLAINGRDLISLGVPQGIEIGKMLNHLMYMVIDEQVENNKTSLLNATQNFNKHKQI